MVTARPARELGYEIWGAVASGGMASVHLGRRRGAAGFSRVVAVKRLHAHLARDTDLAAMLADEARLSARIRHANVVSVLDVIDDGELSLVMEYVHGGSLAELLRAASASGEAVRPEIASAIAIDALSGLHAAHEAKGEDGAPLGIVHRDVSPQNILVGADGTARIVDFGVAKARVRSHETRAGTLKGKLAYMAPEQLLGQATRRSDVLAVGVVLWELLAGRRFYAGIEDEAHLIGAVSLRAAPPLAPLAPHLPEAAVRVVEKAVHKDPEQRFATAEEMARALREALPPAHPHDVGAWVERLMGPKLAQRAAWIERIERGESPGDVRQPFASASWGAFGEGPASSRRAPGEGAPASAPGAINQADGLPVAAPESLHPVENGNTVTIDPAVRRANAALARKRRLRWAGAAALVVAILGGATVALRWTASASPGRSSALDEAAGSAGPRGPSERPSASPVTDSSGAEPGQAAGSASSQGYGMSATAAPGAGASAAPGATALLPQPAALPAAAAPRAASTAGAPGGRGPGAASGKAAVSASPACDPPWELDDQGIKRIKRACLK
jgi:serine/threonine-protein kinase